MCGMCDRTGLPKSQGPPNSTGYPSLLDFLFIYCGLVSAPGSSQHRSLQIASFLNHFHFVSRLAIDPIFLVSLSWSCLMAPPCRYSHSGLLPGYNQGIRPLPPGITQSSEITPSGSALRPAVTLCVRNFSIKKGGAEQTTTTSTFD